MTRQKLIDLLYNANGDGLTLDEISYIEWHIIEAMAEQAIEDGVTTDKETAMQSARDVFINQINDCADMFELRDFLTDCLDGYDKPKIADNVIYRLFHTTFVI